jgi:hypothetical protein
VGCGDFKIPGSIRAGGSAQFSKYSKSSIERASRPSAMILKSIESFKNPFKMFYRKNKPVL